MSIRSGAGIYLGVARTDPDSRGIRDDAGRAFTPAVGSVRTGLALPVLLFLLPRWAPRGRGGAAGIDRLGSHAELRGALALTALCATAATLVGVLLGTPEGHEQAMECSAGRCSGRRERCGRRSLPCRIRAVEVVISCGVQASSTWNHCAGGVTEVAAFGAQVHMIVDEQGVPLVALLTIPSLQDLDLGVRAGVHVSFKAFAVHLC